MRRAFTDRNTYLGDPAFVKNPLDRLLSKQYAAELRGAIGEHATPTPVFDPALRSRASTTHYSVVDAEGNAVSRTTTLNDSYGSAVTVTGAGFLLNDEMDDFATAPGKPNMYGLVQGEANAIAPGKRMLSAMTPSIVVDSRNQLYHGGRDARRAAHHHDGLPCDLERHRSSHVACRCGGRAAHAPPGTARHVARRRRRCLRATIDSLRARGHAVSSARALGRRSSDHPDEDRVAGSERRAIWRWRGGILRRQKRRTGR